MIFHPWAFLIALPPVLGVFYLYLKVKREETKKRHPIREPLLRPPGESCRQKINLLYDSVTFRILWFVVPIFFATCLLYTPLSTGADLLLFLISLGVTYVTANRLLEIRKKIASYQLGFDGERAVGQEINQALSFGCKVYHDVEFENYNIDHVIVAPSGVYSVETKCRRKGHGENSQVVTYDGLKLVFPEGDDVKYLKQTQDNAKELYRAIYKATGKRVWVEPILTFPGWYVESHVKGKVGINVLNPKWIVNFVRDGTSSPPLSEDQFNLICNWLDQTNRIT